MARNLIVCSDGTTNEVAGDSTNVLRLYRCLERSTEQIALYDAGVGTVANPDRITERGRKISRMLDSAMGVSVRAHAIEGYRFLVRNYQPGDRIFLFGFSRGAYTARAVAGMIHFLGLLRPELENLADLAWSLYSGDNVDQKVQHRFQGGKRFRKCFCVERAEIHFVGVWDTVSSFGWFGNLRTLPHTANNPSVRHVRHAVAIDERRAMFPANLFRPEKASQHESFKEVWFAGSHGDVGGGYPEIEGTMSKVPLAWMLREAAVAGLRIDPVLHESMMAKPPDHPAPDPLGPIHESLVGRWHLLELFPRRSYSHSTGQKHWRSPNVWRHRTIQCGAEWQPKPVLHESVELRLNSGVGYDPANLPTEFDIER